MNSDAPTTDTAVEDIHDRPWESLSEAVDGGAGEVVATLSAMSPSDQSLALSRLSEVDRVQVIETLQSEDAAELIAFLPEVQAAEVMAELSPDTAAAIMHEMPSDEQADVLGDLAPADANAILEALPKTEADAARELSAYDDDVAGGMMVREMLQFAPEMTVAEVIEHLNEHADTYSDFDVRYAYVCQRDTHRLLGVLPMQNLLFVKRNVTLAELMINDPLSVSAETPLDELVDFFDAHAFLGVPVVDEAGVLQGVLHREAVQYQETRTAENDYLKSQGIVGGEELRTMPLWLRAKRRLSWLSINILLNIGAAFVIASFQDTLQAVIALAVFLPIISDMSGCSGNQAVAVSMRELSLGLVRPNEMLRVWFKEASVGLINGLVLGLLVAAVALAYGGNLYLGLVVGLALFANTLVAVSIGGIVPLLLKRFNFDPAVASGPLLTTVTDMCGFFLVLGLATLMLDQLVAS